MTEPFNDFTITIEKSITVQARSPMEAFLKAERRPPSEWSVEKYCAECEQCDLWFSRDEEDIDRHDCEILQRMKKETRVHK